MTRFIKSRADEIIKTGILKNKRVLDVGCIGYPVGNIEYGGLTLIHQKVKRIAKKLVGLDINKKAIEKYRKEGFDLRYQDLEKSFNLKEKFDVILANEIIEHLNNPGFFVDNMKKQLADNGKLVISTPNAQGVSFFFQRLLKKTVSGIAVWDHTHWHSEETLKVLLARRGMRIIKIWCVQEEPIKKTFKWFFIKIFWSLFPDRMGRNIICISEKV